MPSHEITKAAIAAGLRKAMSKKKLSSITIKDITEACGISRVAFYYHFKDKYDLIHWIFLSETLPVINTFSTPERYFDGFVNLCNHMLTDQQFYIPSWKCCFIMAIRYSYITDASKYLRDIKKSQTASDNFYFNQAASFPVKWSKRMRSDFISRNKKSP